MRLGSSTPTNGRLIHALSGLIDMAREDRNYFANSEIRIDDVIFLENGTVVECAKTPNYIANYENPYSTNTSKHTIKIGVSYERQINLDKVRSTIFLSIKESFYFFRVPFDDDLAQRYIRHQVPEVDQTPFCVPAGLYVVSGMRKYLRGHQVMCTTYKPADNRPKFEVSFYQGISHPTNIERLRVITDPESFTG